MAKLGVECCRNRRETFISQVQSGISADKHLMLGYVGHVCSLCVEAAFSLGFVCIQEVHTVPSGDE